VHVLSLRKQAGLFIATAAVLPGYPTLEEVRIVLLQIPILNLIPSIMKATEHGWKPEQVNILFPHMVGKSLNLDPDHLPTLHILAPW